MKTIKKSLDSFDPKISSAIIKIVGPEWTGLYKSEDKVTNSDKLDLILNRLESIESDIKDIKNCPTIKKELAM